MTTTEIYEKWIKRVADQVITIEKVDKVPDQGCHPFVIGPKHIGMASDRYGGILNDEVCEKVGCCHCRLPMSSSVHKMITACYIKVVKPCTQKEVSNVLYPIKSEMEQDGIDGFAFLNHKMVTDWNKS